MKTVRLSTLYFLIDQTSVQHTNILSSEVWWTVFKEKRCILAVLCRSGQLNKGTTVKSSQLGCSPSDSSLLSCCPHCVLSLNIGSLIYGVSVSLAVLTVWVLERESFWLKKLVHFFGFSFLSSDLQLVSTVSDLHLLQHGQKPAKNAFSKLFILNAAA